MDQEFETVVEYMNITYDNIEYHVNLLMAILRNCFPPPPERDQIHFRINYLKDYWPQYNDIIQKTMRTYRRYTDVTFPMYENKINSYIKNYHVLMYDFRRRTKSNQKKEEIIRGLDNMINHHKYIINNFIKPMEKILNNLVEYYLTTYTRGRRPLCTDLQSFQDELGRIGYYNY